MVKVVEVEAVAAAEEEGAVKVIQIEGLWW